MDENQEVLASIVSAANEIAVAAKRLSEKLSSDPKLVEIMANGITTFGDQENFAQWLKAPNRAMDGRTPLMVMLNGDWASVEDELTRINYGDLVA